MFFYLLIGHECLVHNKTQTVARYSGEISERTFPNMLKISYFMKPLYDLPILVLSNPLDGAAKRSKQMGREFLTKLW